MLGDLATNKSLLNKSYSMDGVKARIPNFRCVTKY